MQPLCAPHRSAQLKVNAGYRRGGGTKVCSQFGICRSHSLGADVMAKLLKRVLG